MSGVTMLVRWLCSFPASALLAQVGQCVLARRQNCLLRWVGLTTLVLPRPQGNAPLGNEPTGCVLSKVGQEGLSRGSCCHWIMGKECTLTPASRSESELLDLHGPRGLIKSKDKRKRSKQRTIAKRRNERPSSHPEKTRQRTSRSPS